jgi:hypothetical protein
MAVAAPPPGRPALLSRAAAGALTVVMIFVAAACGASASDRYGPLPKFLPASSLRPDSVLTGTTARPALTSEGDEVRVELPGATVLAQVTGPQVPGEGLPYQARATTCTWTITLTDRTAPVRVRLRDFTSIDNLGTIYHPSFVIGQPHPPATLRPGRSTTFELRAVMLTGEGLMRWAPDGGKIVAEWDFEVEND